MNRCLVVLSLGSACASMLTACASRSTAVSPPLDDTPKTTTQASSRTAAAERLYVANADQARVLVFRLHEHGDARPVRDIEGAKTGLQAPANVAVDSLGNMYVSDFFGSIFVFAPDANGNVAPIRHITGSTQGPFSPDGIAVDASDNLYVANQNNIEAYPPGADGIATPIRHIAGPHTMVNQVEGIALNEAGRLYAVDRYTSSVLEFRPGTDGDTPPDRVISGSNTHLDFPFFVSVAQNGEIYVTTESVVDVFAKNARGNVPPARIVTALPSSSHLNPESNAAVNGSRMYVSFEDLSKNSVFGIGVYDKNAEESNPLWIIEGPRTLLSEPVGITIR